MLKKLLKHEFKATARFFLFLYSAVLVLAVINKLFWFIGIDNMVFNVVKGLITAAFVISIVGTILFTFLIIIYRFYKNLLTDEGYLSFTLPVNSTKHIVSKMLVSVLWIILTLVTMIITVLIMGIGTDFYNSLSLVLELAGEFFRANPELIKFVVLIIIMLIFAMFTGILMFYASMTIGHLFSKHRIVASIISFFVIYFIVQALNSIVLGATMLVSYGSSSLSSLGSDPEFISTDPNSLDLSSAFIGGSGLAYENFVGMIFTIIIIAIVMQVVFSAVYFSVSRYILNKKLNLD